MTIKIKCKKNITYKQMETTHIRLEFSFNMLRFFTLFINIVTDRELLIYVIALMVIYLILLHIKGTKISTLFLYAVGIIILVIVSILLTFFILLWLVYKMGKLSLF